MRHGISAFLLGTALAALTAQAAAPARPPVAPQRPVTEDHFGTKITDPYRYFEDLKAPGVMQWLNGEADYASAVLGSIEGRDALAKRLAALADASGDALGDVIERPGGVLFYLKRPASANQYRLYVRGSDGVERVLVDPDSLRKATGVPHAINYYSPSWDAKYVAYGVSKGGDEQAELHIIDVASAHEVGRPVTRANAGGLTSVVWTPDSRAVLFNRLKLYPADAPAEDHYKNSTVYRLPVGGGEKSAQAVFGAATLPALHLAPLDYASMTTSPDSRWVIATINDTTVAEYQVWALELSKLGTPGAPWRRIATTADGVAEIALRGNELFMMTHSGAPNFRILKLDLTRGGAFADATTAIPEQANVINDFTAGADALYVNIRDAFNFTLRRAAYGSSTLEPVVLPVTGSVTLAHDDAHQRNGVLASAESWTQAQRTFAWAPGMPAREIALRARGSFDSMDDLDISNVEVPSYDGVKVPLTIIARKGLTRDGSHPAIVYGYGAYGLTGYDPYFSATFRAWTERGGIVAIAAVRGGGELGDAWHRAGEKATKPNTWKDGIACAEYLVAQKYTSAARLAALGGSAGGIFAGRILTSRPDLFRAIVIQVGMTDTLRSEFSANGATNTAEFGSVKDPQGFRDLLEMSTYDKIVDGTPYPAVLLTHGLNDPRVDIWNSMKTTARLQHASTSGRPILLRVERAAGHGIGSTRAQREGETADTLAFLLWQMDQPGFGLKP
ncbi:MAG TPA: prolyl oligopeptidase family serine peptidase [Steroidobacteraceae bacterium]|nr:prolyl oligopeptidase family serine peptidase [Steroidobacteraceae bacterium]